METWLKNAGFPYISIKLKDEGDDTQVSLTQDRFLLIQNNDVL